MVLEHRNRRAAPGHAELVLHGVDKRSHGGGIEIGIREEEGNLGSLETWQSRSRQLSSWIDGSATATAAASTTPGSLCCVSALRRTAWSTRTAFGSPWSAARSTAKCPARRTTAGGRSTSGPTS